MKINWTLFQIRFHLLELNNYFKNRTQWVGTCLIIINLFSNPFSSADDLTVFIHRWPNFEFLSSISFFSVSCLFLSNKRQTRLNCWSPNFENFWKSTDKTGIFQNFTWLIFKWYFRKMVSVKEIFNILKLNQFWGRAVLSNIFIHFNGFAFQIGLSYFAYQIFIRNFLNP